MLRIHRVAVNVVRQVRPLVKDIAVHDRNLADHITRSSVAVVLNIAEASGVRGNRRLRHETALGEAAEVRGGLDIGEAAGWTVVPRQAREDLARMVGTLVKLTR
ncbi:MAG: four helix bundle protein [Sandaracinus sp.]